MVDEIWKIIEGHKDYKVSNLGNVMSKKYGDWRKLKGGFDKGGYHQVGIDGKTMKVHRLVAKAFISNPENKPEVNHLNEVRNDNRAENLSWVTSQENADWGNHNKRVSEGVKSSISKLSTEDKKKRTEKAVIASKNKMRSEQWKKRLSEAAKGRKVSEETRLKLSLAAKAQWAKKKVEV